LFSVAEAIAEIEKIPGDPEFEAHLSSIEAVAFLGLGLEERGRKSLDEAVRRHKGDSTADYYLAMARAGFGQKEKALDLLERALEKKDLYVVWTKVHPQFDGLRGETRFREILRKMNLEN
jgi:hypothetical protein